MVATGFSHVVRAAALAGALCAASPAGAAMVADTPDADPRDGRRAAERGAPVRSTDEQTSRDIAERGAEDGAPLGRPMLGPPPNIRFGAGDLSVRLGRSCWASDAVCGRGRGIVR